MVSKREKIFHYDIYEDNGIDGTRFFVKLSIDGNNCKARATSKKESRRKASNAPILHYKKKMDKK
jgi:ribonuclease-3